MSVAYFIVLDQKDPGFDTMVNGKFLAQDDMRIRKVAKALGIRPLDEYVSYSPKDAREMMEDMDADPDEIEGTEFPEQAWYEPTEGLDLADRLSGHVRANPSAVKNAKGVLADLEEYKAVFEQAKAVGARWCLQVDY